MKNRKIVVFILVIMFIFSTSGNVNSVQLNKGKMSIFTLDETNRNLCCTVELSAKDFVTKDDQYINAIVLFNKDVVVNIKDLEITREYNNLNGLAGNFPKSLYEYLESAWFVSVIEEDKEFQICSEEDWLLNDTLDGLVQPSENDQLSWGTDWIDAERVWGGQEDAHDVISDISAGLGIKVGVIDSGIDYTHPDLDANYAGGIDFKDDDDDPFDEDFGHGTHVAGIIGAEDNNIPSIIGVAPKVSLYAVRVINKHGGTDSDVIAGMDWCVENEMDVINLSVGSLDGSSAIEQATNRVWDAGIIVVAAAGNWLWKWLPLPPRWHTYVQAPARYENSIAVANLQPVYEEGNPEPIAVGWGLHSAVGDSLDVSAPGS